MPIPFEHNDTKQPFFYQKLRDGRFVASELATSPWDSDATHGAAVSGLLAHGLEQCCDFEQMQPARFHVDFLGAVPKGEITLEAELWRPGKRLSLASARLLHEGKLCARAELSLLRRAQTPVTAIEGMQYPLPDQLEEQPFFVFGHFGKVTQTRPIAGSMDRPGRAMSWIKMQFSLVEDQPLSPFVQAAMQVDYSNGVGSAMDIIKWNYANIDIGVNFLRMPQPEHGWLLLDAVTESLGNGLGIARAILSDNQGVFARGFQTLFIEARG